MGCGGSKERPRSYYYFDTPDGQDIDKKLLYLVKPVLLSTFAMGTLDFTLHTKKNTYMGIISRYAFWSIPIIGCTTAAVLVSNALCILRKKDDELNWLAGGFAVGIIIGVIRRDLETAIACSAIFGTVGYGRKYCYLNGILLAPPIDTRMHGCLRAVRHDMTLLPEPSGEWKTKFAQQRCDRSDSEGNATK